MKYHYENNEIISVCSNDNNINVMKYQWKYYMYVYQYL